MEETIAGHILHGLELQWLCSMMADLLDQIGVEIWAQECVMLESLSSLFLRDLGILSLGYL